jgi:hypothetical protein
MKDHAVYLRQWRLALIYMALVAQDEHQERFGSMAAIN